MVSINNFTEYTYQLPHQPSIWLNKLIIIIIIMMMYENYFWVGFVFRTKWKSWFLPFSEKLIVRSSWGDPHRILATATTCWCVSEREISYIIFLWFYLYWIQTFLPNMYIKWHIFQYFPWIDLGCANNHTFQERKDINFSSSFWRCIIVI